MQMYVKSNKHSVSLGGWIVVFMTRVRSASTFDATLTSTGFWAGMTVGRIALSFLTARLGEFRSVLVYLAMCLGLELLFWLVPSFYVSAVAIALLGMFLGPLFPTAIVLVAKLMPKELHVGSIGFATAFGGSGGAIFPFVVGAIAQSRGVRMMQPVVVAILVMITGLWCLVPNKGWVGERGRKTESEREAGSDCEKQVGADRL
jgi:fucose permease